MKQHLYFQNRPSQDILCIEVVLLQDEIINMIPLCSVEPSAYYFQMVEPYRDKFGLITQADKTMDGGDAAHRAGVFYFGMYLRYAGNKVELAKVKNHFMEDFKKLRIKPGHFVRHPDSEMWYSNPANFSRDQTNALVIALGAFKEIDEVKANFKQLMDGNNFYPNTLKNWTNEEKVFPFDYKDIAGPSDWGMYIRAMNESKNYNYLYFTDLQLLGSALVRIVISHLDDHDSSDDINLTLMLLQANDVMPTPVSRFSEWIFTRFRKVSPFATSQTKHNAAASAWEYYFTYVKERPPLHRVYQCQLEQMNNRQMIPESNFGGMAWYQGLWQ